MEHNLTAWCLLTLASVPPLYRVPPLSSVAPLSERRGLLDHSPLHISDTRAISDSGDRSLWCALTRVASPGDDDFTPVQTDLPVAPPKNAIILFDGKGTNEFVSMSGQHINWPVEDGALISTRDKRRANHLVSKIHFRDADIHVEFMLPPKGSGNSGVYIHGNYELQIFNSSHRADPGQGDMGGIYGFAKPLVNAAKRPGEWQVYDIRYRAPRRDKQGKIIEQGSITAWLNGHKVQDLTRFGEPRSKYHPYRYGTTRYLQTIWQRQKATMVGPLFLQDHDSPVQFRNIWIVPLDDLAKTYNKPQ